MPMGNSPAPACLHGLEPEWTYRAMFWCSLSRYSQPFCSPINCRRADTVRKPVPEEAGFGMTRCPLYTGLRRSA